MGEAAQSSPDRHRSGACRPAIYGRVCPAPKSTTKSPPGPIASIPPCRPVGDVTLLVLAPVCSIYHSEIFYRPSVTVSPTVACACEWSAEVPRCPPSTARTPKRPSAAAHLFCFSVTLVLLEDELSLIHYLCVGSTVLRGSGVALYHSACATHIFIYGMLYRAPDETLTHPAGFGVTGKG